MKEPVLITGSHKSGKSFVAKGLMLSGMFNLIDEPLNVNTRIGLNGLDVKYWYNYIDGSDSSYLTEFERTLRYEYRILKGIGRVRNLSGIKLVGKDYLESMHKRARKQICRPLVDDPFALMSAEWFYTSFQMKMIVMVRHPASFVTSLINRGWEHPFQHFLEQKMLMKNRLAKFEKDIQTFSENRMSILDQGILLWRILNFVTKEYQQKYADTWNFVRFESFAVDPWLEFEKLYDYLGLEFSLKVQQKLEVYLKKCLDVKRYPWHARSISNCLYPVQNQKHYYKLFLSKKEIEYIKEKTGDVWPYFYTEADWQIPDA